MSLRAIFALALVALGWAAPAVAAPPETPLPPGSTVAGVDLSGLSGDAAERELRRVLGAVHERPLRVRWSGRSFGFASTRAGLRIHYAGMIRAAFRAAARGEPVQVPLERSLDRRRLSRVVAHVSRRLHKPARNARVRFGLRRVARIRHRFGRA